jgi:gp16 family phage-associated protein
VFIAQQDVQICLFIEQVPGISGGSLIRGQLILSQAGFARAQANLKEIRNALRVRQMQEGLNSREEAKMQLRELGVPISEWARSKGFEPEIVYALLSGRVSGHWGMAHQVAVALGMKRRPGEIKMPRPIEAGAFLEASPPSGKASESNRRRQ